MSETLQVATFQEKPRGDQEAPDNDLVEDTENGGAHDQYILYYTYCKYAETILERPRRGSGHMQRICTTGTNSGRHQCPLEVRSR